MRYQINGIVIIAPTPASQGRRMLMPTAEHMTAKIIAGQPITIAGNNSNIDLPYHLIDLLSLMHKKVQFSRLVLASLFG